MRLVSPLVVFAVLFALVLPCLAAAEPSQFYVAPNGKDAWSGRLSEPTPDGTDGPKATLLGARDAVRKYKAEKAPTEPIHIVIRGGVYRITQSLELNGTDSGTSQSPIVWQAAPGEVVRLVGGTELGQWKPVSDPAARDRLAEAARENVVQTNLRAAGVQDLGAVAGKNGDRADLICNHRYMLPASYPNQGLWLTVADVPQNGEKRYERDDVVHYGRFAYDDPRPTHWKATDDLWVHGYWAWDWQDQYQRVAKHDVQNKEISPEPPYHVFGYRKGQRFRFVNVLEELDQPGEWFLDRNSGVLYFWPPESIATTEVVFPELRQPFIKLNAAENIAIRGIIFECSRAGAVEIREGCCNEVAGCTARNLGDLAISIKGGKQHVVRSCDVYDIASTGIEIEGGDRNTLAPSNHAVENCDVHHFATINRTYHPAIRIAGVGNRISHCAIHDSPHQGIALYGNDHVIEYCDFTRIAQETGDVGVIYTLMDWTYMGNEVRYNYFHDIHGPGKLGCFVIYPDLPAGGIHLLGNVFHDLDYVFHTNSGRGMLIENNIFSKCHGLWFQVWTDVKKFQKGGDWKMVESLEQVHYDQPPYSERYPELRNLAADFAQGDEHMIERQLPKDNVVRRNVSCGEMFLRVDAPATLEHVKVENNWIADPIVYEGILVPGEKAAQYRNGDTRLAEEFGRRGNRITADAEVLKNLPENSFQLPESSPAAQIGFEPIPFEKIGLVTDEYRKSKTETVATEEPFFSPAQAAKRLMLYFEAMQEPKPLVVRRGDAWETHRKAVQKRLMKDIALDPLPERIALDPHYSEPIDHPWCTIHKVAYQLWPGVYSRGLLYMPKTFREKPAPAMLCPHGHYAEGYTYVDEQTRALMFAKLGYVAFATAQEHHEDLLRGVSCQTFLVWNNMRALDFLQSLPEVNGKRLGVCGLSGGGLQSQMLVATDPRLSAATIAGMTCEFRENLYAFGAQCGCNHWPNTTAYSDAPEISMLGFPAAVQYLTMNDWTASFAADDFPAIQRIYRENGWPDKTECDYWPTGHVFDRQKRERCYWWMQKWVRGIREAIPTEPDHVQTLAPEILRDLKVDVPQEQTYEKYFRGQFQQPRPNIESLADWNSYRAQMVQALPELLGQNQALPALMPSNSRQLHPDWAKDSGVRVEEFLAPGENMLLIPGLLILPPDGKAATGVEVVLDQRGRAAVDADPQYFVDLANRGIGVVVPDLRFTGNYAPASLAGRIGPRMLHYDMASWIGLSAKPSDQPTQLAGAWQRNSITWGRSISGMMLADLQSVLHYIGTDRGVRLDNLKVTARDSAALAMAAIYSACLDPRIVALDVDLCQLSYDAPLNWAYNPASLPLLVGVLKYGDTLQWAGLLADRQVTLRHAPKNSADREWLKKTMDVIGQANGITMVDTD